MRENIDRVQVILAILFFSDGLIFVLLFLARNILYSNYLGYIDMFILGTLFVYTGYKRISRLNKESQLRAWYKQPWILVGLITYLLLIIFIFQ